MKYLIIGWGWILISRFLRGGCLFYIFGRGKLDLFYVLGVFEYLTWCFDNRFIFLVFGRGEDVIF